MFQGRREKERQTELLRSLEQSQRELLHELVHRIEKLESFFLVRDDGNARSAEAYDGLRRTVQAAMKTRTSLLVILAEVDRVLSEADSLDGPRRLVAQLLSQEGLTKTTDATDLSAYRVIGGEGDFLEVLQPAYVDDSGRVVAQGTARRSSAEIASS